MVNIRTQRTLHCMLYTSARNLVFLKGHLEKNPCKAVIISNSIGPYRVRYGFLSFLRMYGNEDEGGQEHGCQHREPRERGQQMRWERFSGPRAGRCSGPYLAGRPGRAPLSGEQRGLAAPPGLIQLRGGNNRGETGFKITGRSAPHRAASGALRAVRKAGGRGGAEPARRDPPPREQTGPPGTCPAPGPRPALPAPTCGGAGAGGGGCYRGGSAPSVRWLRCGAGARSLSSPPPRAFG